MRNPNRCNECSADVLKSLAFHNWLKLVNFVEYLERQEAITPNLAQEMTDSLMSFKEYAQDVDDEQTKEYWVERLEKDFVLLLKNKAIKSKPDTIDKADEKIETVGDVCRSCEYDMRKYEYWTGLKWQVISPETLMLRLKNKRETRIDVTKDGVPE